MRELLTTPTAEPLPYASDKRQDRGDVRVPIALRSDAVAQFDALLHEINPDALRADPTRLHHLMQWLLALPADAAHSVLDTRLRRIEELRVMLADEDWDTDAPTRHRLEKLFAYMDREDDLIDDHEPMIGLLDDVLLLELTWPMFADEVIEYRDFSAWRADEHPTVLGDERRRAWIRDRLAEIELLHHRERVHGSHYASSGSPTAFRVL